MNRLVYITIAVIFILSGSIPVLAGQANSETDFACSDVTEIPQLECEALLALYNSTNGAGWTNHTNWLVTNTPSDWYGVGVYYKRVITINLQSNRMIGSIPAELGNISDLASLSLGCNKLSGGIPPELGNPPFLYTIDISQNQLTGSIPPELGNNTMLRTLDLSSNLLSGNISEEIGNFNDLRYLFLNNNQLTGIIPAELGYLINLNILWLNDKQLYGDIPPTLVNLINLFDPGNYMGKYDGLNLDSNLLNVPPNYPDPWVPLQVFLSQKDPDWQLYQGIQQEIGIGGGELTSVDGKTDFVIPAGAVITDTTFTFIPLPAPRHPAGWRAFANNSFDLSAEDGSGNPVTSFSLPISVTLSYMDPDIVGPEDALGLYFWGDASIIWTDAVTTCPGGAYTRNLVGNTLALPLCHLTEFGLFGNPLHIFLPVIRR